MIDGGRSPRRARCRTASRGAALFADISGFTPLTEALAAELGSQRGAEELTANIGRVFHAVIGELDRRGGDVIYFSGDAITCWIDGDDGTRATAAAVAMQDAMARDGDDRHARRHDRPARAEGGGRHRRRPPVRRRRSRHPAHRRAGRQADRRPRRGRAHRREGRGRPRPVGDRRPGRPGPHPRAQRSIRRPVAPSASSTSSLVAVADGRGRASRRPSTRRWSGRGCCPRSTSACATAAASCWRSSARRTRCSCASAGIDYDDDPDADRQARRLRPGGAADHGRLRRQRPAADARRQGRVPLRRLRVADRPRGRCGSGGGRGPRAARPGDDRPPFARSRSGSPTAGCAAARTATPCGGRSCASATR